MIGDMLNNNKRRDVKTRLDQVMYMGKKYRQDKKTGYYVCTTGSRRSLARGYMGSRSGEESAPGVRNTPR